jgi:uncharacterized membrane protein YeaQ/YmgE (transglycosylase-associated protein family)
MVGSWVFHVLEQIGVTGLNLHGIVVATVVAILFLFICRTIRRHA